MSESTVVRLALRLGYEGFPELQHAIRATIEERPPAAPKSSAPSMVPESLRNMMEADTRNLSETMAALPVEDLAHAVDILSEADYINVIGFRTSFSLAYLLHFLLRQLHPRVRIIDDSGGSLADDIALMTERDALIAISFPRYVRKTAQTVDYALAHSIKTIAITDSFLSPIASADVVLYARHDTPTFFNSNVAATAVVNILVAELAERSGLSSVEQRRQIVEAFYEYELPDPDRP